MSDSENERSCETCVYNRAFYDKSDNTWLYEGVCSCRISMFEGQDCDAVKVCGKWKRRKV